MRTLLSSIVLILAACGGGGPDSDAKGPPADPPAGSIPARATGVTLGAGNAAAPAGHSIAGGALSPGAQAASSAEHRVEAAVLR